MNNRARIDNGVVAEVFTPLEGIPFEQRFPADFIAALVQCGKDVQPGWTYDGKTFAAPQPPTVTKDGLISYAADKRWQVETGGIKVAGVPVATDDRSKMMIMGARMMAEADPGYVEQWKAGDGLHIDLTAAQLIGISNAVLAHVSACFTAESKVVEAIKAGTITTLAEVDAYPWPGST